jgi:hypothetical protein
MELYKQGVTPAFHKLVLNQFHYSPGPPPDPPVQPTVVYIPFEPMQCCIQDFSGMTIGDDSTVAVERITQDCQLVINGLPTGPPDPSSDPSSDPSDPLNRPSDGLSPVVVGLMATVGGLLFVVALYFFLQWVNNRDDSA